MLTRSRRLQACPIQSLPHELLFSRCCDPRSACMLRATCRDLRDAGNALIDVFVVDAPLFWRHGEAWMEPGIADPVVEEEKIRARVVAAITRAQPLLSKLKGLRVLAFSMPQSDGVSWSAPAIAAALELLPTVTTVFSGAPESVIFVQHWEIIIANRVGQLMGTRKVHFEPAVEVHANVNSYLGIPQQYLPLPSPPETSSPAASEGISQIVVAAEFLRSSATKALTLDVDLPHHVLQREDIQQALREIAPSLRCLSFGWNNIDEPSGMLSAVWPPSGSVGPSNLEFLMVPELPLGLAALPAPQRVVQDGRMREELAAVLCGRKEIPSLTFRRSTQGGYVPTALTEALTACRPRVISVTCSGSEDISAEEEIARHPGVHRLAPPLSPEATLATLLEALSKGPAPEEITWEGFEWDEGPGEPSLDERMLGVPALAEAIASGAMRRMGLRFPHRASLMPTREQLAPRTAGLRGKAPQGAPALTGRQKKAIFADAAALRAALIAVPAPVPAPRDGGGEGAAATASGGGEGSAAAAGPSTTGEPPAGAPAKAGPSRRPAPLQGLTLVLNACEGMGFFANHEEDALAHMPLGASASPLSEEALARVVQLFDAVCAELVNAVCGKSRDKGGAGGAAQPQQPQHRRRKVNGLECIGWATHRRRVIRDKSEMPLTEAACRRHGLTFVCHE